MTVRIWKYRGIGGFWWCVSCGTGRNYKRIGDFRTEAEALAAKEAAEKLNNETRG